MQSDAGPSGGNAHRQKAGPGHKSGSKFKGVFDMKKGDRVYISETATKPNARLYGWSEPVKDIVTLPAGTKVYHVSYDFKITAFAPVVTCFSTEPVLTWGYVYMMTLKKDLTAEKVGSVEYRFDFAAVPNSAVEIVYLGSMSKDRVYTIVNKWGHVQKILTKCSFASEYKDLEKELNKAFWDEFQETAREKAYLGYKIINAKKEA